MKFLCVWLFCIGFSSSLACAQAFPKTEALVQGRKYVADLYSGQTAELWKNMTPVMQAGLKSEANLSNFSAQLKSQLGGETGFELEQVTPAPHAQVYARRSRFSASPMTFVVLVSFDDEGKVSGLLVVPEKNPAESTHLGYKDKNKFTFPLKGTWLIYQGGRSTYENYHAAYSDQRFAYDIVGIHDGKLYSGTGDKLEDYFGFAQPVMAPADGIVVAAIDQYDDNPLNKPSASNPAHGNSIVIDNGNGEFSMLAHLKRGSLKVKIGDKVKAGQELALCGNSGNSPIPHLHFHLQTAGVWFQGEGLPLQFSNYIADGKAVDMGEPTHGQVIQSK